MPISSALGSSALLPAGLGHRNKIINGDMRIAQRGTATITGSGSAQYPVDRWAVFNGTDGNNVTFVQSTDAPAGFTNSLLATVSNAVGSYSSSGYTQITHKIEGFNCQDLAYGTASAKTIILSFWVKSSVVGIQNVSFKNGGNNRVYIAKYTIDVAGVWEKKTISIVGDTAGTWLVNSGIGLEVTFNLGMGTGYDSTSGAWLAEAAKYSTSDAIDFAATANATFRVTGVQLEQNYQPTPFEQRPYGTELALCQRYYQRIGDSYIAIWGTGYTPSSSQYIAVHLTYSVPTRTTSPTITKVGSWAGSSTNFSGITNRSVTIYHGGTSGAGYYEFYTSNSTTYVEVSNEL
jgi:hypothetical protein